MQDAKSDTHKQKFYEMATENGDAEAYVEMEKLTHELLRVFIRKIQIFEKTEKYSRTAGNPIIIHFTFQPHADTGFITMNFREEFCEAEQAEIA